MTYRSDSDVDQVWINEYFDDESVEEPLSAWSSFAPSSALVEKASHYAVHGLGADPVTTTTTGGNGAALGLSMVSLAFVAAAIGVGCWLNYQVGKAMAPTTAKRKTWGWIGVPVGFIPFGVPVMAIVSNHQKG
jgi:hypothetical protein